MPRSFLKGNLPDESELLPESGIVQPSVQIAARFAITI